MERATLVLTVIAQDEPGVVERISETVAEHGGNWEQSRMARLGGRFAGILLVEVAEDRAEALTGALAALDSRGLKVVVERTDVPVVPAGFRRMRVELVGQDHTGIIRDISRALAERGVNVEELETSCEEAPMGGGDLFAMTAQITSPPSVAVADLRASLEALANDLMVDITLAESDE